MPAGYQPLKGDSGSGYTAIFLQRCTPSLSRCRFLVVLLLLLFAMDAEAQEGIKLEIIVLGLEGQLKDNVIGRLSINLHSDSENLTPAGIRRLHRRVPAEVTEALAPFGYYNPKTTSQLTGENEQWKAEYLIDKGLPVLVEDVDLQLKGAVIHPVLRSAVSGFALQPGQILDQLVYEEEKTRLLRIARGEGFLDASFAVQKLKINRQNNTADIILHLDTGKQYLFGKTSGGAEIIEDSLMQRYLPYQKGEPFSEAKLFELQSILYRTDYFGKVTIRGDKSEADGSYIPVRIEVEPPAHRNRYRFGAGFATDTGIRGKVDWTNRYLNDRGHRIAATLLVAERERTLSMAFEIPRKRPRYEKLIHSLAYQDRTWTDTNSRLLTGSVAQEYSGPRFKFSMGLEARSEDYDVGATSGDSILVLPSLNAGLVLADDILNTRNGLQVAMGVLGSVDGLISDTNFIQATAGGKIIASPFTSLRLIGRGQLGATWVDDIDSLPPSLRFYTGGDNSIRGYSYKSIGTEDSTGTVIGGRYLVVSSIEMEKILGRFWSLAAFWDVGTATDDLSLDFYQGAGGGVRFRLPFGQIRLDLASAVTRSGSPLRLHFTVGGDF